jgi:glutathione peroxidase
MKQWNPVSRLLWVCLSALLTFTAGPALAEEAAKCPANLNHEFQLLRKSESESLCRYAGQVVLVVNTASRCGFTPQFEGLEALYQRYRDKGFTVLGFPSNDFNQELGEDKAIAQFCKINYGVTFPMYSKSPVKGDNANDLYKVLARETGKQPGWNFNKYLVDRDGNVVAHFPSSTRPESDAITSKLESLL